MEYIIEVLLFLGGIAAGYFTAYSNEKGKNRALKEDVAKLEDQKQQVQIKYSKEIEELKKENILNIELRKHKYQEKKAQFAKFFNLLDEFHSKSNEISMQKFGTIFSKFMRHAESNQNEAIAEFNQELMGLFGELNQEYLKLTTETNSIRLITSDLLDKLLDQLTSSVNDATNTTQDMLKVMASQEFWSDQSILLPLQQKAEVEGEKILVLRNNIRKQMKEELDQI